MDILTNIFEILEPHLDVLEPLLVLIVVFIVLIILLRLLRSYLLRKVKTKKQISNVTEFLDLLKYLFVLFFIIIIVVSYYGTWGEVGFIAGLLTLALGLALQKPISGVVAWLILIVRKPFIIGDRVVISNIKGDVTNISLTHIYLEEVGGTIDGEEKSGRTIMIPTSIIFEQEVINYTEKDDYILDEVVTAITYESNLEEAEKIVKDAVSKIMEPFWNEFPKKINKEPHNRLMFKDSGIDITVRYFTLATKRNAIATDIRREIFNQIRKNKDVEIAYPHTEVLLRDKTI